MGQLLQPTLNCIKLIALLQLFSIQTGAQCENNSEWGGAIAPTDSNPAAIHNCNYAGEYAFVANVQSGSIYAVSSSNCEDYISVYDAGGAMIGHGLTPMEFTATTSGSYAVHFNTDSDCGTEGACRATAISCVSCGALPGCTDPIATNYDAAANYDNCTCIVPDLTNDDCQGAISLNDFVNTDGTCSLSHLSPYSGATSTTTEVNPSVECADGDATPKDVWFSLTVPASEQVSFQFEATPGFSSIVECYTGTCGNLSPYAPVLCNNEGARIFENLPQGEMVYFRVWDYGSNDTGNHTICIKEITHGCTDPLATNYDPNAGLDDGSCIYPSALKPCQADVLELNAACVVGDNTTSFAEPGEPSASCFSGTNYTVWYKFVANTVVTNISTDFEGYTNTDTEVAIYSTTDCSDYSVFTQLDCDQDGGVDENYNSIIAAVPTNIGETYYVQVSGWNGTQGTFCIEATSVAANNEICGAVPITCGETIAASTANFSMSTTNLPTAICGIGPLTASNAFYEITGTGEDFILSLCNSSYDTRLNVFCLVGGDCSATPEFVCVASNDDYSECGNSYASEVRFATMNNSKYYIMVHGYDTNAGNFELSANCTEALTAPDNQDCTNNGMACRQMGAAIPLTIQTDCIYTYGTTMHAAQATTVPPCSFVPGWSVTDVWYTFNSGDHTGIEADLVEYTAEETRIALYESCGDTEPMFCDEGLFYGLSPNTDYYLQVFNPKGIEGDFDLCLKSTESCAFTSYGNNANSMEISFLIFWNEVVGATGYHFMMGTSQGGDDVVPMTDLGDTIGTIVGYLDYNTTYYPTIMPYGSNGTISSCPSPPFTTKCPSIETELTSMIDGSCFGINDGAIDITVSGGEGPYTYTWTGPDGFTNETEDIVQITGGMYELEVVDTENGCIVLDTFTVLPLEGMSSITNIVDEACGSDGAVEIIIFGGAEPYTYQWSTGTTTAAITSITSGNYQVTVTDNEGCTEVFEDIIVGDGGELSASVVNITGVGCGSAGGDITISPVTGTNPYDYNWASDNGAVTGSVNDIDGPYVINSLPAGNYTVTITDVNGCIGHLLNLPVTMIEDLNLIVDEVIEPDCNSSNNGIIRVTATDGLAPFQFSWSNGIVITDSEGSEQLNGLEGGTYSVTVTDAGGCVGEIISIPVTEPAALNVVIHEVTAPACFADLSGYIYIDVDGGSAPFSYVWSNGYTTEDLTGVGAGNYMLTITDNNGCTATTPVITVANPTAIEINLNSVEHNTCFGANNGSIHTGIFGGNPPYTIEWNEGSVTANVENLPNGTYQCTITDQSGCQLISPEYIVEGPSSPIDLQVDALVDNSCNGLDEGSIQVTVAGGVEPYVYNWSNGVSSPTNENLSAGNYLLTVTDANNCVFISDIFYIAEPDQLEASVSTTTDVNNTGNGTATVEGIGGTTPYSFQWDANAGNQTTATATDLSAGTYMLTIEDAQGCMLVATIEIKSETVTSTADISTIKRLILSPNPTVGEAQLLIELAASQPIQIQVYDITGKEVIAAQQYNARQLLTIIDLNGEAAGVYVIKVLVGEEMRTLQLVKK